MKIQEIMREEACKLVRGMVPLFLVTMLGFCILGQLNLQTFLSLAAGTTYSFILFLMIGVNAAKAVIYPPEQAIVIVRKGYMLRYCLTGALLVLVFQCSFINKVAAIFPLFYPKIVLLANSIFPKKGG